MVFFVKNIFHNKSCKKNFKNYHKLLIAGQSSRSVSFKEHQMLAALKLFVFGQACKMTTE
ncbi:hypothetical protein T4E_7901 [Trichinella pseudospiralis]|uniref:Uncharacterized protein n=1 Tax=Trichinella pseudospiralis TaxID=6337 RepID=A0A0V0XNR0_TRIPS|nr:hypothetical protein T4E_7901 [Trichinella pseudospiralis]